MNLAERQCQAALRKADILSADELNVLLKQVPGWTVGWTVDGSVLTAEFQFADYAETTAFVNGLVQIAVQQDHHPEICFGYKTCGVSFTTHSAGGITMNDIICAAKINPLSEP